MSPWCAGHPEPSWHQSLAWIRIHRNTETHRYTHPAPDIRTRVRILSDILQKWWVDTDRKTEASRAVAWSKVNKENRQLKETNPVKYPILIKYRNCWQQSRRMSSHKFFQVCPPSLCLKYFNFVPNTGQRRVTYPHTAGGNIIPPIIAGRPPESLGDQTRGHRLVPDQPSLVLRGAVRGHGKVMAMIVSKVINDIYFVCRTCIVTIWSHLLIIGLQLIFFLALLFLLKHFLEWRITSSGPLRLIAVKTNKT